MTRLLTFALGLFHPDSLDPCAVLCVTSFGTFNWCIGRFTSIAGRSSPARFATSFGASPRTVSLEIANAGTAQLAITSLDFEPGSSAAFTLTSGVVGVELKPTGTMTVDVTFIPLSSGMHGGTLLIESSDSNDPVVRVPLSGTGINAPLIEVEPGSADFGVVAIGDSVTVSVTITNRGTAPLSLGTASLTSVGDFTIDVAPDCCLPVGESTTTDVTYAPSDEGPHGVYLLLPHDAPIAPDPVRVPLAGTTPGSPETRFQRGDANTDARVDIADVIFSLNYVFRGFQAPACIDAADANDDGRADIADPITILNYQFLGGPPPPPPFPDCGSDPTADGLPNCSDPRCPL